MEASKALLRATALPENSTATEHATSSFRPDPAASTDEDELVLRFTRIGRRLDKDWEKIVTLLLWMAKLGQSISFITIVIGEVQSHGKIPPLIEVIVSLIIKAKGVDLKVEDYAQVHNATMWMRTPDTAFLLRSFCVARHCPGCPLS